MVITLPSRLERESVPPLLESITKAYNPDEVTLDFKQVSYSFPAAMLIVACALRHLIKLRGKTGKKIFYVGIDTGSKSAHSYLGHLGFFRFINIAEGKFVGEASGSDRYLPITVLKKDVFLKRAQRNGTTMQEEIMHEAQKMATVVTRQHYSEQSSRSVAYCFREVIRNVFEHSQRDQCFVCAQRWYDGAMQIAVADEGIGIHTTLGPVYEYGDPEDSLVHSLEPGITRTAFMSDTQNINDNSGYGLYVLSELGRSFGWFAMASDNRLMFLENDQRIIHNIASQGVIVAINFYKTPLNFSSVLDDIIQSGEEQSDKKGRSTSASKLSKQG